MATKNVLGGEREPLLVSASTPRDVICSSFSFSQCSYVCAFILTNCFVSTIAMCSNASVIIFKIIVHNNYVVMFSTETESVNMKFLTPKFCGGYIYMHALMYVVTYNYRWTFLIK